MIALAGCLRWTLLAGLLFGSGYAGAKEAAMSAMPESAWQVLEAAQGIQVGGSAGQQASIQVIFDTNCPYCARLYEALKREHPKVAVRWVPIAYFRADSGSMAAAILRSPNPAASLDRDFTQYDFGKHHGGYRPSSGGLYLSAENLALERRWRAWGGFTPMIVIRNKKGRILKTGIFGSTSEALREAVESAMAPQPVLRAYRPMSRGKE